MRPILAALVLLAIVRADAAADGGQYRCQVEGFYQFADAAFVRDAGSELIGERFLVDRADGTISGFELGNAQAQQKMVLDQGSNKQAFKVLSTFEVYGPYQAVTYLYIEEFAPLAEKAFFAVSGSSLLTGRCTR